MRRVVIPLAITEQLLESNMKNHFIRDSYLKKLIDLDIMPILLSSEMDKKMIDKLYAESDGVFFTGGSDVNPDYYHEEINKKTHNDESDRDVLELYLLEKVFKDKRPFLGICRGCQILAIVSGGALIQDISSTIPHGLSEGEGYEKLLQHPKHAVIISETSKLYKIIKAETVIVNSGHHQAVKRVGKDFEIVGKSQDGISEFIESKDPNWFCFGVQSHIELLEKPFNLIFEAFAKSMS